MPRTTRARGARSLDTSDELVLLIPEAAEILRTSPDTIRRMIRDGSLGARKIRNQWRIPRAAIDELVQTNGKPKPKPRVPAKSSTAKRTTKTTKRTGR